VILRCSRCTTNPEWQKSTPDRRRRYLTESVSIAADVSASRALALQIADLIAEGPARDTLVLDIHGLTTISDFFVITSGENERQLRAIARDVRDELDKINVRPNRAEEGSTASGWLLLDYGNVIIHILDVDQRAFYRLEELWSDAPTLLAIE
jgi:ribosome-associated protein